MTSVLSFFVFSKKEIQKTKNEIRLPFYRFPFMFKQTQKTEKQKMTSVLSFFLLCTRKQKKGKTKIDFRFIFVRFWYEQTQKNGKTTNDFLFIVFPFMY